MFLHSPSKFKIYTWQVYKWWRGWTGSSLNPPHGKASRRQILYARLLQIITTGYERFWLVRPSVRPSGIVVFRKCNSSRTAAQNFVNTLYLEPSLYCFVLCVHVFTGKLWFPNFLPFCIYNLFVVKDKGIYEHICRKFGDLMIFCALSPLWNHFVY